MRRILARGVKDVAEHVRIFFQIDVTPVTFEKEAQALNGYQSHTAGDRAKNIYKFGGKSFSFHSALELC